MGQIEVDSDVYERVRRDLTDAAQSLSSAGGKLGSAVPAMAFGPLGAFIPPGINTLGTLMEGASSFVRTRAQGSAQGISTAVAGFQTVSDDARAAFDAIAEDL